jgi:hypothetical protein
MPSVHLTILEFGFDEILAVYTDHHANTIESIGFINLSPNDSELFSFNVSVGVVSDEWQEVSNFIFTGVNFLFFEQ